MDFKLVIKKIIITSIFFSCSWLIDDFSFYITNKNYKPQMYCALFNFSQFNYFSIEYLTIILNLILFVLSFSTSIGEIYAIWFYLYLILMTVFIIIDSNKYKLIATLLIVIIYASSILFLLILYKLILGKIKTTNF